MYHHHFQSPSSILVMDFLSTLPLPSVAISSALVFLFAVLFLRKKKKRYPPIAGTVVHQRFIHLHWLHDYMTELACKYKTYRMIHLFEYAVYTSDPVNVEYMLKTNVANYGKGSYWHSIVSDVYGDGIFVVDGERWLHQRKVSSSQVSAKVIREFSSEIFKTNAVKLAGIIHEAATRNQSIEMQDLFKKSTMDSIVKFLLDFDLGIMSGTNNKECIRFSKALDDANEALLYRFADIFWKIKRFLNIGREAVLRKNKEVVDHFIYKLINRKIEAVHNSEYDELSLRKNNFISKLVERGETDPKYLKDLVLCFIFAGKDTTATTLSWFFYMMCKHPDVQEKIAQEIREATGLKGISSADEVAANLTEGALGKMQYLHAALTETLRLYPAGPMDMRTCFSDDTWPDGHTVKKGQLLVYLPYSMGRMRYIWGNDAEEFRPERWLDENGVFHEESPFKFIAFNGGPRTCMGKEYSYIQSKILVAVLLSSHIFKLNDKKKFVTYKPMITLELMNGLDVHISPRVRA